MHAVRRGTWASRKRDPPHRPPPPAPGLPVWEKGNSGDAVRRWASEASSQQLPSIRGAQRRAGREWDPIRGQAGRLEPGQPYCPSLLSYTTPGLGLHYTPPVLSSLPDYLSPVVVMRVFFLSSRG